MRCCPSVHSNQPSVQLQCVFVNPPSHCVVGECALLIPPRHSDLRRQARKVMQGEGGEGRDIWQSFSSGGRRWKINKTRSKAAGVDRYNQLSGVSWVSMSTLQMGHFLLVANHWSTHAWWKRCMQGNLLQKQRIKCSLLICSRS